MKAATLGRVSLWVCLAGFVLSVGGWMVQSKPPSHWVRIEADRHPIAGRALQVRVHVAPLRESAELLALDLHWMNRRREPQGYLSGTAPQAVPQRGGSLEFRIAVPEAERLGYVFAVIYTSRSGRWDDRTRSAFSDPVAVAPVVIPGGDEQVSWSTHDDRPKGVTLPSASRLGQWISVLIWLAAALLCMLRWQAGGDASLAQGTRRRRSLVLCASACLAAACWELLGADSVFGNAARRIAIDAHLYYWRETAQVALTLAALMIALLVFALIVQTPHSPAGRRLLLVGLNLFAGTSAVALISHHAIDRVAYAAFWTIPALQWLKITGGSLALAGSALTPRRD